MKQPKDTMLEYFDLDARVTAIEQHERLLLVITATMLLIVFMMSIVVLTQ